MSIPQWSGPSFNDTVLRDFYESSYLNGVNAEFIENLYETYLDKPHALPPEWRTFFDTLHNGSPNDIVSAKTKDEIRQTFASASPDAAVTPSLESMALGFSKQNSVMRLIRAYRVRGHLEALFDPIGYMPRIPTADLHPEYHGLTATDMNTVFETFPLATADRLPLREIHALLRGVYCGSIGTEYMHITDSDQKTWIQKRLEQSWPWKTPSNNKKKEILQYLTNAEGLEKYLHTKYVGQKRFSLEGGESLIAMLHELIQHEGTNGIKEIVIGMAHRGRLNVLVNILGKTPRELFQEFEDKLDTERTLLTGDVKYHLGFSSDIETPGGLVHVALARNPSHLEIINPVVMGSVRARQQRRKDYDRKQAMAVLIHGDAAFAGQGVVMEGLNMSQARGYFIGGTMHIIINNQIGFTTSNRMDSRSTFYCTEVAKMVQAPIFHVNADDPEAVLFITQLGLDFRRQFRKDVVIDLVCYRRHGHNEADEPSVTQPMMYSAIKTTDSTRSKYEKKLIDENVITKKEGDKIAEDYRTALESNSVIVPAVKGQDTTGLDNAWHPYLGTAWDAS
ncbi:2-oxoglutarate dehydrogenase E1 component, partial [bacterium]|nr:2-oxoglutarate dehydrogenase E1 component [bacterium]